MSQSFVIFLVLAINCRRFGFFKRADWIIEFLESAKKGRGSDSVIANGILEVEKMADEPKPVKKIPIHVHVSKLSQLAERKKIPASIFDFKKHPIKIN